MTAVVVSLLFAALKPEEMKGFLHLDYLGRKVLWPMGRAMFFMSLGLVAAMIIEALGWMVKVGRLAAPLTDFAHLPEVGAASFTVALVSTPTANGMLSEALDKGEISSRALAVANLLNGSWPSFIVHLPTTLVVATSLAGKAGLAYTVIMFAAATLRLIGAAVLGRMILPPPAASALQPSEGQARKKTMKEIWPGLRKRLFNRLTSLISLAAPIYYLVTLAAFMGFFAAVQAFSTAHLPDFFLPVEAAALIIFSLTAEFSSGFVAAGAMIDNLALTVPQAAAALIIGNILSTPIRALRWQLGPFLGFFKVRLGLILLGCNQGFRVLSLIIALFVFWRIFGG